MGDPCHTRGCGSEMGTVGPACPRDPGEFNRHGAHTGEEDGARRAESAVQGDANPNG